MVNPCNSDNPQEGDAVTENCTKQKFLAAVLSVLRENSKEGNQPMTEHQIMADLYDYHRLHTPALLRQFKVPDFAGFLQSDYCADQIKCVRDPHGTPRYVAAGRVPVPEPPASRQMRAAQQPAPQIITLEGSPVPVKKSEPPRRVRVWSDDEEASDIQPIRKSIPAQPVSPIQKPKPKDAYTTKAFGTYTESEDSDDEKGGPGPSVNPRAMAATVNRQPAHAEKYLQRLDTKGGEATGRRVDPAGVVHPGRGVMEEVLRAARRQEPPKSAPSVQETTTTTANEHLHTGKESRLKALGEMIEAIVKYYSPRLLLLSDLVEMLSIVEPRFGGIESFADMSHEKFFSRYCKSLEIVKHGNYSYLHWDAADKDGEETAH